MVVASLLGAAALAGGPVHVTPADNGRHLSVRPATTIVVTLPSNASTGFGWNLMQPLDAAVIRLLGHDYVAPKTPLVGAPGTEVWRFRTVGKGRVTLRLGYLRAWLPSDVERRFGLSVRVKA